MARKPKFHLPGVPQHIIQHGNKVKDSDKIHEGEIVMEIQGMPLNITNQIHF